MSHSKVKIDNPTDTNFFKAVLAPVSSIRSGSTTHDGDDSDLPLDRLFPRVAHPKSTMQETFANLGMATRLTLIVAKKALKTEVEIAAKAPNCTKPLPVSRDIGPSFEPCNRITQGHKRLRKARQRQSCKDARVNNNVYASMASTSGPNISVRELSTASWYPPLNANGITNASRPLKRLVQPN